MAGCHVKDREKGSQQLSKQQIAVFHMLWDASQDPWSIKDTDGYLIYANSAYLGIFGIKDEDISTSVMGLSDEDLLSLSDSCASSDFTNKKTNDNFTDSERVSFISKFNYTQHDEPSYFIFDKIPITNSSGLIIGFCFHGKKEFIMTMPMLFDGIAPLGLSYNPPNEIFSLRELDVIFLLILGQKSIMISECLGVSKRTSETYIHNVYSKAGVRNYFDFISYCYNNGFVNFVTKNFIISH